MPETKTDTLVILAAGASSRMKRSLEKDKETLRSFTSKALLPLGEQSEPAITHLIRNAKKAGLKRILMVVPEKATAFRDFFGRKDDHNKFEGIRLGYAVQHIPDNREKPLGTADALQQTLDQYSELNEQCFLVCNGDNLYSKESLKLLSDCPNLNALIGYDRDGLDFPIERIIAFALLQLDQKNNLISIREKPSEEEAQEYRQSDGSLRVSMNLWKFRGDVIYPFLKNCPIHPKRNEKELPQAVLNMIDSGVTEVAVLPFKEHVPDLTSAEDIEKVESYLRQQGK